MIIDYVRSGHPDFAGIEPAVSPVSVKTAQYRKALGMKAAEDSERKVYSFTFIRKGLIKSVLRITADTNGNIIKINTSK